MKIKQIMDNFFLGLLICVSCLVAIITLALLLNVGVIGIGAIILCFVACYLVGRIFKEYFEAFGVVI